MIIHPSATQARPGVSQETEPPTLAGPAKACTGPGGLYTATLSGNWSMTAPNGTTITGPSGVASWTPTFPTAGVYRIRLSGSFCTPEPLLVAVKAPPARPDSLLGPGAVCTGIATAYTAKNTMTGTFFAWTANAPTQLNAQAGNTTFATFSGPGADTVSVRRGWNDLPGCLSAPLTRTITRPLGAPQVGGKTTPCANSYENYGVGASFADADYYEWSILPAGAGSVSAGQNTSTVSVLWNNTTVSTPARVVVKARRCSVLYFDTLAVTINGVPAIAISPAHATVCANDTVHFSITPALTGSYSWDLGQTTSSASSPNYPYQTTGATNVTYPVSVTVTNPNGCTGKATATTSITVKPAPVGSLTPAGTYVFCGASNISLPATLTANAQSGFGGPVTTVNWYHNGALTPPATPNPQPSFTYGAVSQFGSYYAVLTSANGCSSRTDEVKVIESCGSGCTVAPGYTVSAALSSQGCSTAVITSSWTSGGINQQWAEPSLHSTVSITGSGTNSTATYTFDAPGQYTVTSSVSFPAVGGGYCPAAQSVPVLIPYLPNLRAKITCSGSSYNVNLLDNSAYYPSTPIQSYKLYDGSGTLLSSSATATNVLLTGMAPGTYTYTLVIAGSGYAACTTTATLNLPAMPSVSISASRTTACIKDAVVHFTPNVTPAGAYTYLWDFGDLSSNTQAVVGKVYSSTGFKPVTLTVTNLYGCTATANTTVDVVPDNLNGQLAQTPNYPCEGQIVSVYYDPNPGSTAPVSYQWYQPPTLLSATGSSLNVIDPGGFFVRVEDIYGCTHPTNTVNVNIRQMPDPVITGDSNQCDQKVFTLNGNVGPGNYTYSWYRDGSLVQSGPSAELEQSGLAPGTYVYTLAVSTPNPPAGSCQKMSQAFTVTVHDLPANPWIDPPHVISCSPYTLKLTAGASVPGTFNWSNGMSGSGIITYAGGDYRVYFTDTFGCSSKAGRAIPRDPNSYLWIFPTGCYQLCEKDGPFQLVGPQAWFNEWTWLYNNHPDLGGVNSFVAPYLLPGSGFYNLMLDNGLCNVTSGNMDVTISGEGCVKDPQPEPCEMQVEVGKVYSQVVEKHCEWYVHLQINNPYGMAVPYHITSSVGNVIPSTGSVPAGSSFSNTYRMAFPTGFSGGPVTLTLVFNLGEGRYCIQQVSFDVVPCGDDIPWGKMAPRQADGSPRVKTGSAPAADALTLVPNPANGEVAIGYNTAASGSIEVYDVLGRRVAAQSIGQGAGAWKLDVSSYVPGVYRVVLRQEGKVVLHQSLSIKH